MTDISATDTTYAGFHATAMRGQWKMTKQELLNLADLARRGPAFYVTLDYLKPLTLEFMVKEFIETVESRCLHE